MKDPLIPVVKNPKLHEPSDYERMKGGIYEAGKWSTFLHLLVTPIIAKYGFGKISDPYYRKNFIKALKEALSKVKVKDVKAYLHKARLKLERVDYLEDGFLLPPLEEVLQDPKKRDEFVSWLRVALREVGVRTYKEEIDKMIDRVYPLAMKMHDKFISRWGGFDEWGNPITTVTSEEVKKWEEFEEYLKILEEFAGLKRMVEHPTPTKTIVRTPTHEVEIEVPEREARTAERAKEILTDILSRVEAVNGKVGIPLKAIELAKKELEIERYVGEKAFELLGTSERNSLVEGILDEEIVRIGREIREVRGKDVLNEAIEDANQKIIELDYKVVRLVIAKRIAVLNLLISILNEVLRNLQRYGILSEEGKLYVDYQMFITEFYPRLERALKEK